MFQERGLEDLEAGHQVRVVYRSDRSGNEVERDGKVERIQHVDDTETPIIRVAVEEHANFKKQYVTLTRSDEAENAMAFSQTAEPDGLSVEEVEAGRTYTMKMELTRTQFLGPVRRVLVDTDNWGVSTDGGEDLSYRCFGGCGRRFASLGEMVAVPGKGDRDPRHFCEPCAGRARRGPPLPSGGGSGGR